jgi:two-component system NtrC family response regulator
MKNAILAISDKKEVLRQIRKELGEQYEVITFNNLLDAMDMLRESEFDVILLDEHLTWFNFIEAKRKLNGMGEFIIVGLLDQDNEAKISELREAGIYNYMLKPLTLNDMNRVMFSALINLELKREKRKLEEKLSKLDEETEVVGQSTRIKESRMQMDKLAGTEVPVLIIGENGTGKTYVASGIHKKSDRRKNDYIEVSCSSFATEAFERELFGYEKGAFQGATVSRRGLLEESIGGTVFLDEIADVDIKTQSKLLQAIEYAEIKRVGGTKPRKIDIRFILSTSKDLKEEVEKGKFRKDLYNRIIAFSIDVPTLRERKEDIPLLASYFLNKIVRELHKDTPVISGEAMKYIMEYSFPGNIRELRNMIERMVILSTDKILDVDDLPIEVKMKSDTVENKIVIGVGPLKEILEKEIFGLDEVERVVIAIALQKTRWNKQETSKLLGIGRTTLYEKIRKYGLDFK